MFAKEALTEIEILVGDKLRFVYLSLPFFDKSEEECETGFEKWIYVLKYVLFLLAQANRMAHVSHFWN